MRPWTFISRVFIPLAMIGILASCGGGGSSSGILASTTPPIATFTGVATTVGLAAVGTGTSLNQYTSYTFTATSTEPTLGRTVASFIWDFGDGSGPTTYPATAGASTVTHAYAVSGTFAGTVLCVDDQGLQSAAVPVAEVVAAGATPVTITAINPAAATVLQVQSPLTTTFNFQFSITDTAGTVVLPATGSTSVVLNPGEATATQGAMTVDGSGNFNVTVTYPSGAVGSSTPLTPTLTVTDSLGNTSAPFSFPVITLNTTGVNHPPTVIITTPASPTTSGFTSKAVNLGFTVTDQDGDPVTYKVDWGDGTPVTPATAPASGTVAGVAIALTHAYADSFTSGTKTATATVTVDDGRTSAPLPSATCKFAITYNTYPTASITSPQTSGTLPSPATLPSNPAIGLVNPPSATSPELVVVPNGGPLNFAGSATLPGSGDAGLTYSWSFPGGSPSSSNALNPPQVIFSGTSGVLTPYLVTFTVTDAFNRVSSGASGVNVQTYEKWVIVDGTNTQNFNLTFLFRQKSGDNGVASLVPAQTGANGYGSSLTIFQDGISSVWQVASGNQASVTLPVRSNLPFYAEIPSFGGDSLSYMVLVPNAPTGPYADPTLVAGGLSTTSSSFSFKNASAPFDPTLEIVTGQGFASEGASANEKTVEGTVYEGGTLSTDMTLGNAPANDRWVDRLSVPTTDPSGAIQFETNGSNVGAVPQFETYQGFAEWLVFGLSLEEAPSTTVGASSTLGFNLNYSKYTTSTATSDAFGLNRIQAYRVPAENVGQYPLDTSTPNWNNPSCFADLNPTAMATGGGTFPALLETAIYNTPGSTPLGGGINGFNVPYKDAQYTPTTPVQRTFNGLASTFSYAEYLWSSVWARPKVLQNALLADSQNIGSFGSYYTSSPAAWPKKTTAPGISPDGSYFDMTPTGSPTFQATSPVGTNGNLPGTGGVGRFFWTAYTPNYNGVPGSLIARTWQSTGVAGAPPLTFTGSASGDATSVLGFIPPQDPNVITPASGAFRVFWFNPTVDANGATVPPDFWVVALGNTHFVLPASYPVGTQSVSDPLVTDARTFLPSGLGTLQSGDTAAPGYCWFDVPLALLPSTGGSTNLTVFAVKSILKNAPIASLARALNRPDWMDAIKTGTANMSVNPSPGSLDLSFAYKVPLNFPWDIVMANSPATTVNYPAAH